MNRLTNISEAFINNPFKSKRKDKIKEDLPKEYKKPEFEDTVKSLENKFNNHSKYVDINWIDPTSGVASTVQGKMGIKVNRNRFDQSFTIYIDSKYGNFLLELSKDGYNLFKANNIAIPTSTIILILLAIQDIQNYTGWEIYDKVLETKLNRDLKLGTKIKESR